MSNDRLAADGANILIIGAGGHAKVVIDVARAAGFEPVAALDPAAVGDDCNGVKVVGDDNLAAEMFADGIHAVAVAIGDNRLRCRIAKRLGAIGFIFPALVHPSAVISGSAKIGGGTVVMPNAVVNADASVGDFVIVNSAAVVEHDCVLGRGAHVAPGTRLGGCVSVGCGALVGIGSAVRPGASIGDYAVVGAGSTIIADIPANCIAVGSPARVQRI